MNQIHGTAVCLHVGQSLLLVVVYIHLERELFADLSHSSSCTHNLFIIV